MTDKNLNRLDAHQIEDDLIRSLLYSEIVRNQSNPDWQAYTIRDRLRPERLAYQVYGIDYTHLKWAVCVAAGLDNWRDELEIGQVIRLPDKVWIREKIRDLKNNEF